MGASAKPPRNVDGQAPACERVQPRLALVLAVACAALAVSAVAVDLAYELEARLDSRDGEGWRTAATSAQDPYAYPGFASCAGPELRLRVHNDRLVGADVRVHVTYAGAAQDTVVVVDETWHLARGETRTHEFTIPGTAFEARGGDGFGKPSVGVNAQVDGLYLGTCVQEDP